MHPALYQYKDDGEIPHAFYAPELLSSSCIVRNQHAFYNEARLNAGLPSFYYKMAANNPRNPVNKADELEKELIDFFNKNRGIKKHREIIEIDGNKFLYIVMPFLENQPRCLVCHGKRDAAPIQLQKRYALPGVKSFILTFFLSL